MDIVLALTLLVVFLVVLALSSHLAITNVLKISEVTGLKTTLGFFLLAFSTSLPELSVAIIASLGGRAELSVGNVIGSNIVNICLIIGLAALLVSIKHSKSPNMVSSFAKEDLGSLYFGLFVASIIPMSLVYLIGANWLIGLILILIFVFYTFQSLIKIKIPSEDVIKASLEMKKELRFYVALTLLGAVGVVISAYFIVESAVFIAEFAGLPRNLVGATVTAFGTSLPKLFIDIRAFLKGHSALAFGDIIGSAFLNITLILGITLIIPALLGSTLTMSMQVFQDLVIFSLIANLFLWYFLSIGRLSWKEGAILLFLYLLFLATSLGAVQLHMQPT